MPQSSLLPNATEDLLSLPLTPAASSVWPVEFQPAVSYSDPRKQQEDTRTRIYLGLLQKPYHQKQKSWFNQTPDQDSEDTNLAHERGCTRQLSQSSFYPENDFSFHPMRSESDCCSIFTAWAIPLCEPRTFSYSFQAASCCSKRIKMGRGYQLMPLSPPMDVMCR